MGRGYTVEESLGFVNDMNRVKAGWKWDGYYWIKTGKGEAGAKPWWLGNKAGETYNWKKPIPDDAGKQPPEEITEHLRGAEYSRLSSENPEKVYKFYDEWLAKYGGHIRFAADQYNIPRWLLASVILGERINIDNGRTVPFTDYEVFSEDDIERRTIFGNSVGLAQLRPELAIKYHLTPGSRLSTANEYKVRCELLDPSYNIYASAKFLSILMRRAIRQYQENQKNPSVPKPTSQFLDIDWSILAPSIVCEKNTGVDKYAIFDKNFDWAKQIGLEKARKENRENEEGAVKFNIQDTRRKLAAFFGAAHNDDSVVGLFLEGIGLTEGDFSRNAFDDLIRFDLLNKHKMNGE